MKEGGSQLDWLPPSFRAYVQVSGAITLVSAKYPRQDSNLRTRLRRPLLYPLSYGGPSRAVSGDRKNSTSSVMVDRNRFPEPGARRQPRGGGGAGRVPQGWKRAKAGRRSRGVPRLCRVPGMSGRVLVVDDDKDIRQLIKVNLELEGFEVVTAADGVECLDVVHGVRLDLVTLDVVMPRVDGYEVMHALHGDPRHP